MPRRFLTWCNGQSEVNQLRIFFNRTAQSHVVEIFVQREVSLLSCYVRQGRRRRGAKQEILAGFVGTSGRSVKSYLVLSLSNACLYFFSSRYSSFWSSSRVLGRNLLPATTTANTRMSKRGISMNMAERGQARLPMIRNVQASDPRRAFSTERKCSHWIRDSIRSEHTLYLAVS